MNSKGAFVLLFLAAAFLSTVRGIYDKAEGTSCWLTMDKCKEDCDENGGGLDECLVDQKGKNCPKDAYYCAHNFWLPGLIMAIVIPILIILCIAGCVICCVCYCRHQQKQREEAAGAQQAYPPAGQYPPPNYPPPAPQYQSYP